MLKALGMKNLSWLTCHFNVAWESGTVPKEWQTGEVVPLFKKRNQSVCANYRAITPLSLPGNAYSKVVERRVRLLVEPQIEEEQCGFCPGRGIMDQLFTLTRILEGAWEYAHPVYMSFVDLEMVYDRVPPEKLWEYGVRRSLLRAIQALYSKSKSCVCILNSKSDSFLVGVGLHQGCALSATLFVTFMDRIPRRSHGGEGLQFGGLGILALLFEDNVVLMASSACDLQ